jgi:RND family efflux transporter MFP subunit
MDREALSTLRRIEAPDAALTLSKDRRATRPLLFTAYALLVFAMVAGLALWRQELNRVKSATAAIADTSGPDQQSADYRGGIGPLPILSAAGFIVARHKATVSSQVVGKIAELYVEEGMEVEAGQVLARLDDSTAKAEEALAVSQLEAAQARVAEANVLVGQARRHFERLQVVYRDALASQAEFDQAKAELDSQAAKAETSRREVDVATQQLAVVRNRLDELVIRAPFAGIVISRDAQPGEIISPSSAGGAFTRTGIGTIVDISSMEVEVDVNEAFINRVAQQQVVETVLDAYPDWAIPSHVINIVPTANRQKATVKVRIALDQRDARILPDMGAKVQFFAAADTRHAQ